MIKILCAEMRYHRHLFMIYIILTIAVPFLERALEDGGRFYLAMLLFLLIQNWLALKSKEKRDRLLVILPLPIVSIAAMRLIMILVGAFVLVLFYKGMHAILGIQGHANYPVTPWRIVHYYSVVLFMFSIYFIATDLIAPRMRERSQFEVIKERFLQILMGLALLLNIFGIYAMLKRPDFLITVFELLYVRNPFIETANVQLFLVFSVFLAALSVVSFGRRKNYIYG